MLGLFIKSLSLKGVSIFPEASIKIEPGITAIYGLNRTNARTSGNGNGAGKSFLVSQLSEVLYESPIVGEHQDRVRTGVRTVRAIVGGKHTLIRRSTNKLDVKVDGKSQARTKPMAEAWLRKHLPISCDEYGTYVHIDARVPHPLVMGSSTERKRFFTSFFGIDKMDTERKLFLAELAKLSKVRAAYTEILKEYREVKANALPIEKLRALKVEVKGLATTLQELNEKNTRLHNIKQLLSFEQSASVQLKEFGRICDEVSEETFDDLYKNAKLNLKSDLADLKDAQEWQQYQRDTDHYTKAMAKLSTDATKLITKLGAKTAKEKCITATQRLRKLSAELKEAKASIRTLKALLSEPLPDKVPVLEVDRKELRAALESLQHQYDHAKKFKAGTCETCGQSVVVKDPAVLKERIAKVGAKIEQLDAYEEYSKALKDRERLKTDKANAESMVESLEPLVNTTSRYAALTDELTSLPHQPAKFLGKKLEVSVKQRMVDEDRERIQLLDFLRPNLDTIIALSKLTDKQRSAGPLADKLASRINECHEKLSKLRAQLEVNALVYDNLKRLRTKLVAMKAELVNEAPLKLLVEGYSDKAMKRLAIKAISTRLMTEVNKYAKFVFPEDYKFDFKWETSQLSLMVHRKYTKVVGKKKVDMMLSSDVRKLSGAESKLFTLVLVLALLTFVPARKRCNLMVLDEPAANFSIETLERFKVLLPILNKVIPSIIIVTPRSDERYGAREFTVVKDTNGNAKLVEGHPDDIRRKL